MKCLNVSLWVKLVVKFSKCFRNHLPQFWSPLLIWFCSWFWKKTFEIKFCVLKAANLTPGRQGYHHLVTWLINTTWQERNYGFIFNQINLGNIFILVKFQCWRSAGAFDIATYRWYWWNFKLISELWNFLKPLCVRRARPAFASICCENATV